MLEGDRIQETGVRRKRIVYLIVGQFQKQEKDKDQYKATEGSEGTERKQKG
jgi:hypothetical protein